MLRQRMMRLQARSLVCKPRHKNNFATRLPSKVLLLH